jgi:Pentapeptide repeats (8 copies)
MARTPRKLVGAWKSVRPDFRTRGDWRWPFPGQWAEAVGWTEKAKPRGYGKLTDDGLFTLGDPCPRFEGDGVCLAKTARGAASGGIPIGTVLIVGYDLKDVLGEDTDKLRVRRAFVFEVLDGQAEVRRAGRADLGYANLGGADLGGADLGYANLGGADLRGADLRGADLRYANLGGADLRGADLRYANLGGADLGGADLGGADLGGADLGGARGVRRALNLKLAYLPEGWEGRIES